jgi:hypothetical protein
MMSNPADILLRVDDRGAGTPVVAPFDFGLDEAWMRPFVDRCNGPGAWPSLPEAAGEGCIGPLTHATVVDGLIAAHIAQAAT